MELRRTLLALIVLALVGGYAWYVNFHHPQNEKRRLFKIDSEDIQQIEIAHDNQTIVLARDHYGQWKLEKPLKAEADQLSADNLANAIAGCEVKRELEKPGQDLAPFGLDKPTATLKITLKNKTQLPTISVGKATPIGFSAYVKVADRKVLDLVPASFRSEVTKKVEDLRNRQLTDFATSDVNRLVITHADGKEIELKKENGVWRIVRPGSYATDLEEVTSLLSALSGARVATFVNDNPTELASYGLDKPQLTVAVYVGKANAKQSLMFGKESHDKNQEGYYVKRGEKPAVYTVHKWLLTDLDKSLFDLRDKTVLGFDPSAVTRIEVARAKGGNYVLERANGDKWELDIGGKKTSAQADKAAEFLKDLKELKGDAIVEDPMTDAAFFGMDHPDETVSLIGKDGALIGKVSLARVGPSRKPSTPSAEASPTATPSLTPADYKYFATSSTSTAVFKLPIAAFNRLDQPAEHFEAKPTPTPSPSEKGGK